MIPLACPPVRKSRESDLAGNLFVVPRNLCANSDGEHSNLRKSCAHENKYGQSNETQVLNRNRGVERKRGTIQKIGQTSIIQNGLTQFQRSRTGVQLPFSQPEEPSNFPESCCLKAKRLSSNPAVGVSSHLSRN